MTVAPARPGDKTRLTGRLITYSPTAQTVRVPVFRSRPSSCFVHLFPKWHKSTQIGISWEFMGGAGVCLWILT